jgi:hypothetical protein
MRPRRTISGHVGIVCTFLAGLAAAPPSVFAESAALQGVLVLDNGNVLAGDIERVGDQYVINVTGATLHVPVDQVERFAPTLEEAYEQRRVTLIDGTADRHLELAAWCLHLELFDLAARELLDARRVDAQNPGVETLERRLRYRMKLEADRVAKSRSLSEPTVPSASKPTPADLPLPAISVEAQARFVRSIQPMLIRNCSTSGCHQAGADHGMQLDRWALQGRGNAELVRRNLAAVLAEVDVDDLAASALFVRGRAAHGDRVASGSRALSAYQLALLTEWVNQALGVPVDDAATPLTAAPITGSEQVASGAETIEYDPNVMPASFTPRDAFDPAIFNRRRAARRAEEAIDEEDSFAPEGAAELSADESAEALSSPSESELP